MPNSGRRLQIAHWEGFPMVSELALQGSLTSSLGQGSPWVPARGVCEEGLLSPSVIRSSLASVSSLCLSPLTALWFRGGGSWQTHYTCFVTSCISLRACSLCLVQWLLSRQAQVWMHFPGSWHDETWLAQLPCEHLAPLVFTVFPLQAFDMVVGTCFKDRSQHTWAAWDRVCVYTTWFPGINEGETNRTNRSAVQMVYTANNNEYNSYLSSICCVLVFGLRAFMY